MDDPAYVGDVQKPYVLNRPGNRGDYPGESAHRVLSTCTWWSRRASASGAYGSALGLADGRLVGLDEAVGLAGAWEAGGVADVDALTFCVMCATR
jgi:hypothetical protein